MKRWALPISVLLTTVFLAAGYAQEAGQVVLETLIQKEVEVVNEKGEKEVALVEVGNAIPGDELILTITYTNRGDTPAENVVLVNPVPEHTEYVEETARGGNTTITYSVDGGETYDLPVNLKVHGEDGSARTARARDYTHVRWVRTGPLSPGESGKVFFRVRLQ